MTNGHHYTIKCIMNDPMLIYRVDGTIEDRVLTQKIPIEECWEIMGGYLEKFKEDSIYLYFADEEGLMKGLPLNPNFDVVGTVMAIPKRWFD